MARKNLSIKIIAEGIGTKRPTLSKKLKRNAPLYLDEACKITQVFFPELDVPYLFKEVYSETLDVSNIQNELD